MGEVGAPVGAGDSSVEVVKVDDSGDEIGTVVNVIGELGFDDCGGAGTDETGADETGADETGADETGADETGADETGADETGADETGADETGADETGAEETGMEEAGIEGALEGGGRTMNERRIWWKVAFSIICCRISTNSIRLDTDRGNTGELNVSPQ